MIDRTLDARTYEDLPDSRKASLFEYLRTHTECSEDWTVYLEELIKSTIARRVYCNESLDASALVAEIMPIIRTRIPEKIKEGLFRRSAEALYGDQNWK